VRRVRLSMAVAVLPFALAALKATPGPSHADYISCSTMTGSVQRTSRLWTFEGCSGQTGGSGSMNFVTGFGRIKWTNGRKTVILPVSFEVVTKDQHDTCPSDDTEYKMSGKVARDTTGSASVDEPVDIRVCVSGDETLEAEPGTPILI
jgi:hypothetical protein